MNVLVACEESQRVCAAFRELGDNAYSCDIIDCSGGHPEWHIKQDVLEILEPTTKFDWNDTIEFTTCDGVEHIIDGKWDLIIAHPPCTYLTTTGNRWFNIEKYGDKARQRCLDREDAVKFFMSLANANCEHICIENPVGIMSTRWKKPEQIIQPYMFGDPYEKRTCLWLKNLPKLIATDEVKPEERTVFKSGKTLPTWFAEAANLSPDERSKVRSRTFPGIANAIATQFHNYILSQESEK